MTTHYVSNGAWNHLLYLARERGYVRSHSDGDTTRSRQLRSVFGSVYRTGHRAQGISTFLNVLASVPVTRDVPSHVARRHEQEIASGWCPSWRRFEPEYDVRLPRTLTLTTSAADCYLATAVAMGVLVKGLRGGPLRYSKPAIISAVLEAYGCGLLVPLDEIPYFDGSDRRYAHGADEARSTAGSPGTGPVQRMAHTVRVTEDLAPDE